MASMKRNRGELKRWSKEDKNLLLDIVKEDGILKFEKPTAQMYYNRIMKANSQLLVYGWKGHRDKMRYLRVLYTRAIDWRNNTGAGIDSEDKERIIREYILKTCVDFDIMDSIFGERKNIHYVYDTSANLPLKDSNIEKTDDFDLNVEYVIIQPPEFVPEEPAPSRPKSELTDCNAEYVIMEPPKFVPEESAPSRPKSERTVCNAEYVIIQPQPPEFVLEESAPSRPKSKRTDGNAEYVAMVPPESMSGESTPSTPKKKRSDCNSSSTYLEEMQKEKLRFEMDNEHIKLHFEQKRLLLEQERLAIERMKCENDFALNKMRLEKEMALKEMELKLKYT